MKAHKHKQKQDPARSWRRIRTMAMSGAIQMDAKEAHKTLMLNGYAQLEKLRTGLLDPDGLWLLFTVVQFGDFLALRLIPTLEDSSSAEVAAKRQDLERAAGALAAIAQRSQRMGKFGASGTEIQALRDAMALIDQLSGFATAAQNLKAVIDADLQVSKVCQSVERTRPKH